MNEPLEMDNPTKKKAPTSKRSRKEDHRQQGDLVVEAFNSLIAKCKAEDDDSSATRDGREKYDGLVIDQIDLKSDLLFQLHSSYLPQLRHQITTLSESLKPSDLLKNPHSKFNFISEIQLYVLQYALTSCFLDAIICVFYHFGDLIRQLKLTTQKHDCKADLASVREDILCEVDHSLFMIEEAITWVNGSEFDIVQVGWRNEKREIGESVQELLSMISPANPATKGEKQSERKPLSESATQLAKSVVPVMKLSRLFFDKMSRRGMNQKKLPLYTTMSSHQLNTIDELAQNIEGRLTTILRGLGDADTYHEPDTSELLTEVVQEIEAHFDAGILLILLHFVPIIPDTDGFPVQNYYKDWLATWNTQLSIAVNNHLEACKIFEQNAE
ncbi:hypothetical protein PSHT_15178 [Puccinia striiformis]|uniref:Uncharacterized protein n=1 Tax=Puccinia striiformis TaxID=27350 RepID=A0A2S4UGS9_9BASI|nr:hypothetical protein PSHT_15178 [Puccinia striiformis]